jgi:hypothetical protein
MQDRGADLRRVAVAAIVALAVGLGCEPGATSAIPSPSAAALGSPSQQPDSPPSAPTTRQGTWTSLRWSAPSYLPDGAVLTDLVAWRDGYVAVGQVSGTDRYLGAAFVSVDGVQWQRTTADSTFSGIPNRLVMTASRLFAFGARMETPESPEVWSSVDGRTWQRQDSLALPGRGLGAVAGRDTTMVALGLDQNGRSMIRRSIDGAAWTEVKSPSDRAIIRNVASVADGFIALGREGQPDTGSGGVGLPGVGRPAAWWSGDGGTWTPLKVEGDEAAGAQLVELFKVADGFFAAGSDNTVSGRSARTAALWSSTDGRDWRLIGAPPHWGFAAANGKQAVVLAFGGGRSDPEGWTSFDGRQWTPLELTGDVNHIPVTQQFVGMSGHIDRLFVVPRGVLVTGQVIVDQRGIPAAWFAEASAR